VAPPTLRRHGALPRRARLNGDGCRLLAARSRPSQCFKRAVQRPPDRHVGRVIGRYVFKPRRRNSEYVIPCAHRDGIPSRIWERHSHEIVVKPCSALSCRYPFNGIVVRPERYGNVANPASQRHDPTRRGRWLGHRGRWPGHKARSDGKHSCIATDIGNRSNAGACERFSKWRSLPRLRKTSSSCTDGCQTSFQIRQPTLEWMLQFGGEFNFSTTCRNVRNYKTYHECRETGMFLAWRNNEVWWYCSSLLAGGRLAGENVPCRRTQAIRTSTIAHTARWLSVPVEVRR